MEQQRSYRRVGILGGMGPAASARLYERVIARTPARCDQDHLPLIIDNNPQVPDRTRALLEGGPNPLPLMLASIRRLLAAEAECIGIACNTAHAWYEPLAAAAAPVPVLHLIRLAAAACRQRVGAAAPIGVMATGGTLASGLYQAALGQAGLEALLPDEPATAGIMQVIHQVKAGEVPAARERARVQAAALVRRGARVVLLGCTELSLVLQDGDLSVPVVDSTETLAETIVQVAGGRVPLEALRDGVPVQS